MSGRTKRAKHNAHAAYVRQLDNLKTIYDLTLEDLVEALSVEDIGEHMQTLVGYDRISYTNRYIRLWDVRHFRISQMSSQPPYYRELQFAFRGTLTVIARADFDSAIIDSNPNSWI